MPDLLSKDQVCERLGFKQSKLDEERSLGRFPSPLICKLWSNGQIDDYISQLEAYGGWDEARYLDAMERRREKLAI